MPDTFVIGLVFFVFLLLLFLGMHISSILLGTGILGIILLESFDSLALYLTDPFYAVAKYTLTTVPLFLLMSQFVLHSGIVKDMFLIISNISRGKSIVLGPLTIILGGILGAVSGSGTASSAVLGKVAVPELRSRGYSAELAGTTAALGGSLSAIIPPSILLILYGSITLTPISQLFIAAVIPGILLIIIFIISIIVIYYFFNKSQVKNNSFAKVHLPVKRYIITLVSSLTMMAVIFVGIYKGLFTPTEAGGIGALVALITALVLGKVNTKFIKTSLNETIRTTAMVLAIVIGAQVFARFISISLLPRKIIAVIEPLIETPVILIAAFLLLYFILFMFIEGAAVIVMTVPITVPIIEAASIDPLWFGILICLVCTLGLVTPPVGLSVYAVAIAAKVPLEAVFRQGVIIAIIGTIVVGIIMVLFPELVTWLPSKM